MPAPKDAEDRFIEAVGASIEFWGFKRILGHTWAWLYLQATPQDAPAIGKRLGVSKAAVSTALKELEAWGCIVRTRHPGERRELFEAEQDVWAMVSRVFRQRELPRLVKTVETFDGVRDLLKKKPGNKEAEERVERLADFARIAIATMQSVLEGGLPK